MAAAIDRIAELTRRGEKPEIVMIETEGLGSGLPGKVPALARPGAGGLESLKTLLETYRTGPERRTGTAQVTTLTSFIDMVNRHKDEGTVIFGKTSWPEPKLTAVVDYHTVERAPRHLGHRIVYTFPVTEELKAWISGNGKPMEQADFARFLEDHAAELSAPFDQEKSDYERLFKETMAVPIDLIKLSRDLEVFVGAKVKRAERLQTGERTVQFIEEHTGRDGEKVDIPGVFMIAVPAFIDGEPVRIPARLRYRVAAGAIHWSYRLYRWEFWLREQVQQDLIAACDKTQLPGFEGAPEGAAQA